LIRRYGGLPLVAQDFYAFSTLANGWVTAVTRDAAMRGPGSRRVTEAIDTSALAIQSQPDDRRRPIFTAFDRVVGGRWTFDRLREGAGPHRSSHDPALTAEQEEAVRRDEALKRAAAVVAYSERAYVEVLHPLRQMLYEATTTGVFRMVAAESKEEVAALYPRTVRSSKTADQRSGSNPDVGGDSGGGGGGGGGQRAKQSPGRIGASDDSPGANATTLTDLARRWRLPRDFFVGDDLPQAAAGFASGGGGGGGSDDSGARGPVGRPSRHGRVRVTAENPSTRRDAYHLAWPSDHKVWRKITPEAAAADYLAHFCADPADGIPSPQSDDATSEPQSKVGESDRDANKSESAGFDRASVSHSTVSHSTASPVVSLHPWGCGADSLAARRYPKQWRMEVTPIPDKTASPLARPRRRAAFSAGGRRDLPASPPPRSPQSPPPPQSPDECREIKQDKCAAATPASPQLCGAPSRDLDADERRTITDFPLVTTCRDLPVIACMTMPSVNSFLDPSVAVFEPLVIPDLDCILEYDRARKLRYPASAAVPRASAKKKKKKKTVKKKSDGVDGGGGGGGPGGVGGGGGDSPGGGGGGDDEPECDGEAETKGDETEAEAEDEDGDEAEDRLRRQLDSRRCVRQMLPLSKIVIEIPIATCERLVLVYRMAREADAAQTEADAIRAQLDAVKEVAAARFKKSPAKSAPAVSATRRAASVATSTPCAARRPLLWCMYCPAIDMLQFGRIDDIARPLGDDGEGGSRMSLLAESAQTRFAVDVPQWLPPLPRELTIAVPDRPSASMPVDPAVAQFLDALLSPGHRGIGPRG
jgi:uncharacterized membrane protein YgcG